ncbi:MAG: DUF1566 domain-containing protein [Candidatus Electrothrix sp. AUS1_2]|nr:DUF1566 domain-containing protein [Candidatus Electrothrix sp. AUS1_2]
MRYLRIYLLSTITIICLLSSPFSALSIGIYIDNGETILDTGTGLIWQKRTGDINMDGTITSGDYPDGDEVSWQAALEYCENLSLAGESDWRLPNIRELQSLVDEDADSSGIDSLFQLETATGYWSSTQGRLIWFLSFKDRTNYTTSSSATLFVRCVRGGLWGGYRYLGHIHQTPMYGPPGTTFTQSGSGFTSNSTVTLQFRNHLGELLTPIQRATDATGSFSFEYTAPIDKPVGTHSWWVVDDTTKQVSEVIGYRIISTGGQETAIGVGSVPTLRPIRQDAGFGTLSSEGTFDPTKETFVIVHGWNIHDTNSLPDWVKDLGHEIKDKEASPATGSNILYWNWQEKARGKLANTLWDSSKDESCMDAMIPGALLSPTLAGLKYEIPFDETEDSGKILALALSKEIPKDYDQDIHLIGHSLGSLVVSYATKFAVKKGFHFSDNIDHLVLMDSPCYFGVPGSEFLENNKELFFIENYISLFGRSYKAADVNVWMWPTTHSYPQGWYQSSVTNFGDQTPIHPWGFFWWQEENRSNVKPDYYLWDTPLLNEGTPAGAAREYMDGKITEWVEGYLEVSDTVKEQVVDYAQYAGKTIKIKAVNTYNTVSDVAGYATDAAGHVIHNSLGYITLSHSSNAVLTMPVTIPAGANALSFGYEFLYGESGSMLEVFINDIPMHHVTCDHALGEGQQLIPWINVEPFAGQTAALSLRLSNSTEGTEGKIKIDDLIIAQIEQRKSVAMPWLMLLLK